MPSNEAATIDSEIAESQFCSQRAKRSIRITCYGSSSAKTPVRYLTAASNLGYTLAKRGHICVNGAGSYGCMAAMNDGAVIGNGHIIGVIHEMFVVDNWGEGTVVRDGGAHTALMKSASNNQDDKRTGPIREILVAGGSDLQQRKRLLVEKAEGLVVLPGGPGTWDGKNFMSTSFQREYRNSQRGVLARSRTLGNGVCTQSWTSAVAHCLCQCGQLLPAISGDASASLRRWARQVET